MYRKIGKNLQILGINTRALEELGIHIKVGDDNWYYDGIAHPTGLLDNLFRILKGLQLNGALGRLIRVAIEGFPKEQGWKQKWKR